MNPLVFIAAVVLLTAIGLGCDDGDRPSRTQNARVNAVIETIELRDGERLRGLMRLTSLPCTDGVPSLAQPSCQGEADGTYVEVFQANVCEPGWLREAELGPLVADLLGSSPEVYAAFETPQAFYLPGRYAVVFEADETRTAEAGLKRYIAIGVDADTGQITGVALGCGIGEPAHFLLPHQNEAFDGWLIEPP